MTATCAMHGRGKGARAGRSTEVQSTLDRARSLFSDLSEALEQEITRLRKLDRDANGTGATREVTDLVRENQKALGTVLDLEAKLLGKAVHETPGTTLDLEDARAEIARRLARLSA